MPSSCPIGSLLARAAHAAASSLNRNIVVNASTASSGAAAPAVAAAAPRRCRPSSPASPIRRSRRLATALELRRNFSRTPAGAQAVTAAGHVSVDQFNSAVAALRAASPDRAAPTAPAPIRLVTAAPLPSLAATPAVAHATGAVVPTMGSAIFQLGTAVRIGGILAPVVATTFVSVPRGVPSPA